jgi:hypothetical protein
MDIITSGSGLSCGAGSKIGARFSCGSVRSGCATWSFNLSCLDLILLCHPHFLMMSQLDHQLASLATQWARRLGGDGQEREVSLVTVTSLAGLSWLRTFPLPLSLPRPCRRALINEQPTVSWRVSREKLGRVSRENSEPRTDAAER